MAHEPRDIDPRLHSVQCIEIAAVVFPGPGQTTQDRLTRNILDGLHHAREHRPVGGLAGCEGEAAVAHQRGGHTVPGDRRQIGVPSDLGVEMGVEVDETRAHHMAPGVDLAAAARGDLSDG